MATGDYCTRDQLKKRLGMEVGDTQDDALLDELVTAASRAIDDYCQRRFYAVSETRTYTPEDSHTLAVDDLLSVTTLKTDEDGDRAYEVTWGAARDYWQEPGDDAAQGQPYTQIVFDRPDGRYRFMGRWRGVQIVGSFGYAAVAPKPVVEACIRLAERLYKLKDAPLGVISVIGAAEGGTNAALMRVQQDKDIAALLERYRNEWVVV